MEYDYQVQLAYAAKFFGFMPDTYKLVSLI